MVQTPDITFLYENPSTQVDDILTSVGIDLKRPIMGLSLLGKNSQSYVSEKTEEVRIRSLEFVQKTKKLDW